MIDIEELWESEELSGTYLTENERSPNYEKVVKENQEISEFNELDLFDLNEEKPLTEKEIQAQRRASRFK